MFLNFIFTATSFGSETIPSEICFKLGVSPDIAEYFETLYTYTPTEEDKQRPTDEYTRIMTKIEYAHLGDNAHLWRVDFVGTSSSDYNWDTIFYINADNNETGRVAVGGTDELITFACRDGSYTINRAHYTKDGERINNFEPKPIFALDGTSLYIRYDEVRKNERAGKLVFTYRVMTQGWIESQARHGAISTTSWFPEAQVKKAEKKYY
jgi:hypothetical protein